MEFVKVEKTNERIEFVKKAQMLPVSSKESPVGFLIDISKKKSAETYRYDKLLAGKKFTITKSNVPEDSKGKHVLVWRWL